MEELKKIVQEALREIQNDPELCSAYPMVCAYATAPNYAESIIATAATFMVEQSLTDPYLAIEMIETQLSDQDE